MSRIAKRVKTVPLIIAVVLIGIAGIGFYRAIVGVQNLKPVLVAPEDLAAYTFVTKEDLKVVDVPEASITPEDLTVEEYDERYVVDGEDRGTVLTDSVLADQRIDERQVAEDPEKSFAVVLPDERVVAANTTMTGGALGTIRAGDIVDISTDSGTVGTESGGSSSFAKVICIATDPSQCESVLPPGVRLETSQESDNVSGDDSDVTLLLAVAEGDASAIAGRSVTLSLNPFCRVDRNGFFISTRTDEQAACTPPSSRLASQGVREQEAADAQEEGTSAESAEVEQVLEAAAAEGSAASEPSDQPSGE